MEAFVGRSGEDAWIGVGGILDDLWEDVVEELSEHLDWTGAGSATLEDYPPASEAEDADARRLRRAARQTRTSGGRRRGGRRAPVRTIARGGRITASPAEVAAAAGFWESVGILPVEVVVPDGRRLTLRCYVEDVARFLGRDGDIYLFATPAELARFCAGTEDHDLSEIATWPEVAETDVLPLPADQDRYDLSELSEVLDGGGRRRGRAGRPPRVRPAGRGRARPRRARRAGAGRGAAGPRRRRWAARSPAARREPHAVLRAEDAAVLRPLWDEVVTLVSGKLVFRD